MFSNCTILTKKSITSLIKTYALADKSVNYIKIKWQTDEIRLCTLFSIRNCKEYIFKRTKSHYNELSSCILDLIFYFHPDLIHPDLIKSQISRHPSIWATSKGVIPLLSTGFLLTAYRRINLKCSILPRRAAKWSGVDPLVLAGFLSSLKFNSVSNFFCWSG